MKKKILLFCPYNIYDNFNGSSQDIKNRIDIFQEMGFKVRVVCLDKKSEDQNIKKNLRVDFIERKEKKPWVYFETGKDSGINSEVIESCSSIIDDFDPDILWFEYLQLSSLAKKIKQSFPGKKFYFRSHNYERGHLYDNFCYSNKSKSLKSVLLFIVHYFRTVYLEKLSFKIADNIFCISKLDISKYKKKIGEKKMTYLPFFAEYKNTYEAGSIRKNKLDVVYMGSNLEYNPNEQGLKNVLEIAKIFDKEHFNFHILGENIPEDVNLPKNTTYHGFVEDLSEFLNNMDIALVPIEIGYGMKIKVYELLKRGVPAIISEEIDKIFNGKVDNVYLVANEVRGFVKKLKKMQNKQVRIKLSKNSKNFMQKNFNKVNIKKKLEQNFK